jgi:hypothetical protein
VQSETSGGRGHHPAALAQYADDMLALDLLDRGTGGQFRGIVPYFGQRSTQAGSSGKNDRPFNEVFESPERFPANASSPERASSPMESCQSACP